uniref:Pyridine nucleotide-disulfide oxidoreductase n=1 Tax=Desulfomonile tiedjei TaxID=2358 RepID=A0A7C4EY45_9BACT
MRFVVIGGDAAGMSAASKAKRNKPDLEVIVLEATSDVSYSACGMPYNIAQPERIMDDLVVRKAEVFRSKQGIDLRLGHTANALDKDRKLALGTADGGKEFEVSYDKLLIATGARPIRPQIPGMNLPGVHVLKSLQDGRNIKQDLASRNVKDALIVGMGYIGLEMAEALVARGIRVHAVDLLPRLLPWLPQEMADVVQEELADHDVKMHFGVKLQRLEPGNGKLKVILDQGEIAVDLVLVAIGIVPNSELASAAGLALGPKNAIAVDKTMKTSDPDIYAAGDCADAFHIVTGKRVWIPLALRANRAGWAVADNITGSESILDGVAGTAVFKVMGLEVARTGLSLQEAADAGFQPVDVVIKSRSRAHAHPGNQTIHVNLVADKPTGKLLGGSMVGREGAAHRINALAVALHAGMTVEQFFQCDFAYAPPFSPVWDPLLTAANQLTKSL